MFYSIYSIYLFPIDFKSYFADPIADGMKSDSSDFCVKMMKKRSYLLVKKLKSFVDRRDAKLLLNDLPGKKEFVIGLHLNKFQRNLYQNFLASLSGMCNSFLIFILF